MKRLLRRLLTATLILLLVFFGWLLFSESGLRWSFQSVQAYLPDEIQISKLSGRLIGPIHLQRLQYADRHQTIALQQVEFDWQPWALLSGRFGISRLQVASLDINRIKDKVSASIVQPTSPDAVVKKPPEISLPMPVTIDQAAIHRIHFSEGSTNLVIERIQMSAQTLDNAIEFDTHIQVSGGFEVSIQGVIKPLQNYAHDLSLSWRSQLAAVDTIEGAGKISGDLSLSKVSQQLQGALPLTLKLEVSDVLAQANWQAEIYAANFDTTRFDSSLPALTGEFGVNASGDFNSANAMLWLEAESTEFGNLTTKGDVDWQNNEFEIKTLTLDSGNSHANVTGRVGETLALDWSFETRNIAEFYADARGLLQGSGKLTGDWMTPTLQAVLTGKNLTLAHNSIARLDADLLFDLAQRQTPKLQLDARDIHLQGQEIRRINISTDGSQILADLDSQSVQIQLAANGDIVDQHWRGQITRGNIQTTEYANWKLKKPALFDISSEHLALKDLCLQSVPGASLCTSVRQQNLHWKLDLAANGLPLNHLRPWLPDALALRGLANIDTSLNLNPSEQLSGSVSLDLGAGAVQYGSTSQQAKSIDYRNARLTALLTDDGITLDSYLRFPDQKQLEVKIQLPKANPFNLQPDTQTILGSIQGEFAQLDFLEAFYPGIKIPQGELAMATNLSGSLSQPGFNGSVRLNNAGLKLPELNLHLKQINLDAKTASSNRIDYQMDALGLDGKFALRGNTLIDSQGGWPSQFKLTANGLQMADLLNPWLPESIKLQGLLNASADLSFRGPDALYGQMKFNSAAGILSYPLLEGEKEKWNYRNAEVAFSLEDTNIHGKANFELGQNNHFKAAFKLPDARLLSLDLAQQALDGEAFIDFQELDLIAALAPEIDNLQGSLAVKLGIAGKLAQPRLNANAEIRDAALHVPRLGLQIDQIDFNGNSNNGSDFDFKLSARSGGGTLAIVGKSQLDAALGWPTELEISGENFEVSRIPEVAIKVSPQLLVKQQHRQIEIEGDIDVPYAKLQPRDISTAAKVSEDTVIIGGQTKPQPKWSITSQTNLRLGERVSFFGFGFEARLQGNLLIREHPGQLTRGVGEINIPEGRYRAYGQRLDIEKGRLLFTGGPVSNPGLDIRAIRTINEVVAGIQVRGRLQQPRLELFSIPAMGETDALSYLLLGRPMETASNEDGASMAKAALALGLVGGDKIARSIGDRFGLDEMRVESSDTGDQASLVMGRYLSPRLYVSYGVGLIESVNSLNLRYQISKKWQLKAESGINQGADLLYTIER